MRRTAAILLSLGIVIPAMTQAAAQKRVLVPAAQKAAPAKNAAAPTGVLGAKQRSPLAAAAKAKQEASGCRVMDDTVTGARLAIPIKHAPQASASKSGTRWSSGRGEVQIETFRIAEPGTTLAAAF